MASTDLPTYGEPMASVVTSVTSEEGYVRRGRVPRALGRGDNELQLMSDELKHEKVKSETDTDDRVLRKVSLYLSACVLY